LIEATQPPLALCYFESPVSHRSSNHLSIVPIWKQAPYNYQLPRLHHILQRGNSALRNGAETPEGRDRSTVSYRSADLAREGQPQIRVGFEGGKLPVSLIFFLPTRITHSSSMRRTSRSSRKPLSFRIGTATTIWVRDCPQPQAVFGDGGILRRQRPRLRRA